MNTRTGIALALALGAVLAGEAWGHGQRYLHRTERADGHLHYLPIAGTERNHHHHVAAHVSGVAAADHRHDDVPDHTHDAPQPRAAGSRFELPFFSPAMGCIHGTSDATRCDNPLVNGFLHIVNRGTEAATVTITGKDANGAGGTRTEANIPAGGNRRVQDHILEGATGFNFNGTGAWSLVVTSTSPDIQVAAFSVLGNPAAGFTALPVIEVPEPETPEPETPEPETPEPASVDWTLEPLEYCTTLGAASCAGDSRVWRVGDPRDPVGDSIDGFVTFAVHRGARHPVPEGSNRIRVGLSYFRSTDSVITPDDTREGSGSFEVQRTSHRHQWPPTRYNVVFRAATPQTAGTYYYGVCVDAQPHETNTANNCSNAVEITVLPRE